MTARKANDRRKLTEEERKKAYSNRFKPDPAIPDGFELDRVPREAPRMIGGASIRNKDPSEITPRELIAFARENSLPVLQRLYEIAMAPDDSVIPHNVIVEACCQFLNRAGLYEVKGQVAAIYAKVQGDIAKIDRESDAARVIDTSKLMEGLGPKGEML